MELAVREESIVQWLEGPLHGQGSPLPAMSPAKVRIVAQPLSAEDWDPDSEARTLTAFLARHEVNPARYTIVAIHKTSKECCSVFRKVFHSSLRKFKTTMPGGGWA
jgi:hypothetical protein